MSAGFDLRAYILLCGNVWTEIYEFSSKYAELEKLLIRYMHVEILGILIATMRYHSVWKLIKNYVGIV